MKIYGIIISLATALTLFLSCSTEPEAFVRVENYNTLRITEDGEHSNNTDPKENKMILPYVLEEDRLDLLAGGIILELDGISFKGGPLSIIQEVRDRGFSPTHYIYYSNDTKETDTTCIYENENLVYYSRAAYHFSPLQKISIEGNSVAEDISSNLKDYSFSIDILPEKLLSKTKAEYYALADFFNFSRHGGGRGSELNDAEIFVNGMKLKLEEDGEIVPYIEFEVKTLNSAKLEMFNEWSYIGVTAPTGATYGNYIEENK